MAKNIYELSEENFFTSSDIDDRIRELKETVQYEYDAAEFEGMMTPREELNSLRQFLVRTMPATECIADSYWDQFAVDTAGDIYGSDAVDSGYWNHDKFSDELRLNYREITLAGILFLYR